MLILFFLSTLLMAIKNYEIIDDNFIVNENEFLIFNYSYCKLIIIYCCFPISLDNNTNDKWNVKKIYFEILFTNSFKIIKFNLIFQ